jgi:hypothetical protein
LQHHSFDPIDSNLFPTFKSHDILGKSERGWRMSSNVWSWAVAFPGEELVLSPWRVTVMRDQSDVAVEHVKKLNEELRADFATAIELGARLHGLLSFDHPICERVPPVKGDWSKLDLSSGDSFREGIPLGVFDGVNASVYSHYTFVVWYSDKPQNDKFMVEIVGVEVIPQQPVLIEEDLSVLVYSYSVAWRLAPESVSSSQFPKWGVVAHSEWFLFANTAAVVVCLILTLATFAVLQLPALAETEEQLTSLIAQRHSSVEPASLPLKFLFLYVVVAIVVFCVFVGAILLGSTFLSLRWGSGSLYRFLGVLFPLLVAVTAFCSGFAAIQLAVFIKQNEWSIITLTMYVTSVFWLVFVPLIGVDIWLWGSTFLPVGQAFLLIAIFLICCVIMWFGAFVARWLSLPKRKRQNVASTSEP